MKDQPEDNFEQRIRERLQSLESDPPAGAWDRLAADLPVASSRGYRRWAALILLLGAMGGGAAWWATTDSQSTPEEVSSKSASGGARGNLPVASEPKSSAKPVKPAAPSEVATRSAVLFQSTKPERVAKQNQTTVRPRLSADNQESASRSSADQAAPALAKIPKQTTRYSDSELVGQHSIPMVAATRPTTVAELPKVALVLPPSPFASKPKDAPEPAPAINRWEGWANANPLLLYQRVAPNPADEIQITSLNRPTFSQDRLGLQLSAGGLYHLNQRLALKLGVYYRYTQDEWTYNYHENVTDTFRVVRIDENTVEATPVYEDQLGTVRESGHTVGVLAGVQYRLSSRWFGNILGAELQAQSLADNPAWYAHVSYVAERKLSNRWSVYGGPSFLWNFGEPRFRGNHLTMKPYGFGAQVGIGYRLQ